MFHGRLLTLIYYNERLLRILFNHTESLKKATSLRRYSIDIFSAGNKLMVIPNMKACKNQKSILSFFGSSVKRKVEDVSAKEKNGFRKEKSVDDDDSPIKKSHHRRSCTIQSDSEEEEESKTNISHESTSDVSSPQRKRIRKMTPEGSGSEEANKSPEPNCSSTPSVGFSPETVPPLRKTARKQIQRQAHSIELKQVEAIKRLKSPTKDASSDTKRTNCLEQFIFKKTPRTPKPETSRDESSISQQQSPLKVVSDPKETDENQNSDQTTPCKTEEKTLPKSSPTSETPTSSKTKTSSKKKTSSKNKTPSSKNKTPSSTKTTPSSKVSLKNTPSSQKKTFSKKTPSSSETFLEKNVELPVAKEIQINSSDSPKEENESTNNLPAAPKEFSSPLKSSNADAAEKTTEHKPAVKNPFAAVAQKKSDKDTYDPSLSSYDPIRNASWKNGEDVPFSALSKTFEIIEETSGRLKTIEILSNFLRSVIVLNPSDLLNCLYLCLNKVAPSFEGIELGIGEIYLCRALAQATGRSVNAIKADIADKGDLGIVAEHSKSNQRMMFQPARLTVKKVFSTVKEIALMSGQASQTKKLDKIKTMLVACKGSEARFLIRFFGGKLRIGLAEQSVLQAIAQACFFTPPGQTFPPEVLNGGKGLSAESLKTKVEEFTSILKTTYCECPSFDSIIPVLLTKGLRALPEYCKLEPGIPLKPMLAHPTKGVAEVLKRFEKATFTCQFKYDGERAQIHLQEDGTVKVFSRNQENNTSKYPDIVSRLKDSLGPDVKSCILDSEAVAFDVENNKILPFQILSTRKKKDASESDIKVQVCVFPFDLLFLNGRNLVTEPLQLRRSLLRENFVEKEGQFTFATSMDSNNTEDIEEFLEESIKGNCEGLMVKSLDVDATYEIAKRSHNWLKLKKDYLEGVGDTIDVVVIGGFWGKGKRTGTYGGFLLACYDPENEEFQSLCKLGTGLKDDILQQHAAFLKEHVIASPKSYYRYDQTVAPDEWFEPVQVWEIKCADLSVSPVHKAAIGIVDPEKGISLRFPRFLRIRDDKTPEEATSSSQIADLYRNQDQIKNQADATTTEDDFY